MGGDASRPALRSGRDVGQLLLAVAVVVALLVTYLLFPVISGSAQVGGAGGGASGPTEASGTGSGAGAGSDGGTDQTAGTEPETGTGAESAPTGTAGGSLATDASRQISGRLYRSQNASVLFVAHAQRNMYWRQDAYQTYTGTGWERDSSLERYDGSGPVSNGVLRTADVVQQRIELEVGATALPTAWQPTGYRGLGTVLYASETGGLQTEQPVPAGSEYVVESRRPVRDATALANTARNYPEPVVSTYTQMPSGTPDRISRLTDQITEEATTPYGKARAIEAWLESNKEYSLNVTRPQSGHIVDSFLFEMEKGYCQYFASAMVAMLRSEGIPARYVVGFAPGEQTDDDTYVVRETNGHAWVEVYFADVGWVRFDPTPGDARRAADRRARDEESQTPTQQSASRPYELRLNRTAKPGVPVTVTVVSGDDPVEGARVFVNDSPVGTTNANGNVTTAIPYDTQLNVTARTVSNASATTRSVEGVLGGGTLDTDDGGARHPRQYRLRSATELLETATRAQQTGNSSQTDTVSENYSLPSNVSFEFGGPLVSGRRVPLWTTVADIPMREATVTVDGRRVGTTDANGSIAIPIRGDPGTNVTVRVERGAIAATTNRTIGDVRLNATVDGLIPYPGQDVTVTVRYGGSPTEDAPVTLDGRQVGRTDANGTLGLQLPVADSATITATVYGQTARERFTGLYWTLAALVGLLAASVLVVGGGLYRYGVTPRVVARYIALALGRVGRALSTLVVSLAASVGRAIDALRRIARAARPGDRLRAWLDRLSPATIIAAIVSVGSRLLAPVRALLPHRGEQAATATEGSGDGAGTPPTDDQGEPFDIRRAWAEFVRLVRPPRVRTRTPGEIARYAISAGFPERPVRTVTAAFRDTAYGQGTPAADRIARVKRALAQLRAHPDGGSSETDESSDGERR